MSVASQNDVPELPLVRRYEAAGFRAWPAASVHYDGTWVIRLTAGHPGRRLNSVNPLDPDDAGDLAARIARAERRFEAYGRRFTFRLTPLSGPRLAAYLDGKGWSSFAESVVMQLPLAGASLAEAVDQLPLRDIATFTAAALRVHGFDPQLRAALSELIGRVQPEVGLFVLERNGNPVASLICVRDNDLAGCFELATTADERGRGHARSLMASALKWARARGARQAWLQVEADNSAARRLYGSLGFAELYRYHYRQPLEG